MQFNVVLGFPKDGITKDVVEGFKRGVRASIASRGQLGEIKVVYDTVEFFALLMGSAGSQYNLCILLDELGGDSYTSLLGNIKSKNPQMREIIIVPNDYKGGYNLASLLSKGIYNVLFQCDVNTVNLWERIVSTRTKEDALWYCRLNEGQLYGGDVTSKENEVMVTGNQLKKREEEREEAEEKKQKHTKTRVVNGVTIHRMLGGEAALDNLFGSSDERDLAFKKGGKSFDIDNIEEEALLDYEFELEPEWIEEYKERLKIYFTKEGMAIFQSFENGRLTNVEFKGMVLNLLPKNGSLTEEQKEAIADSFIRDTTSYGKLDVLLNHPDVSDIVLRSKDVVTVQMRGVWYRSNIKFKNNDEYAYFVGRICTKNHVSMNKVQAQVIFSDIDTNPNARLRFIASDASLNTDRLTSMHIRKIDKIKKPTTQLIKEGLFTVDQIGFLINAVRNGLSIIIVGGSGSGKTVLTNELLKHYSKSIRGVFVQEAEEAHADDHPNIEFMHTVSAKGEGKVEHTLVELATTALLKNVKIFGIGEIKGKESRDFFSAANTGAQVICTTHAQNAFEGIPRLADLAKYGADYSQEDLLKMFSRCIDVVVYMERYNIKTVARVVGWDSEAKDILYDVYDLK